MTSGAGAEPQPAGHVHLRPEAAEKLLHLLALSNNQQSTVNQEEAPVGQALTGFDQHGKVATASGPLEFQYNDSGQTNLARPSDGFYSIDEITGQVPQGRPLVPRVNQPASGRLCDAEGIGGNLVTGFGSRRQDGDEGDRVPWAVNPLGTGSAHLVVVVVLADQHRPRSLRPDAHDFPVFIRPRLDRQRRKSHHAVLHAKQLVGYLTHRDYIDRVVLRAIGCSNPRGAKKRNDRYHCLSPTPAPTLFCRKPANVRC